MKIIGSYPTLEIDIENESVNKSEEIIELLNKSEEIMESIIKSREIIETINKSESIIEIKPIKIFEPIDSTATGMKHRYLPNELIIKILNYVSNYDDLLIIKQVDGRFESLVADIIKSKVVLVTNENSSPVHQMYHTNEWINISDNLIAESSIVFKLHSDVHQHIRKLIISNLNLMLNSFNFINLIHLEINSTANSKLNSNNLVLTLAELENLSIKDKKNKVNFVLDCPKLKNLKIDFSIDFIKKVIYPQSVETLNCLNNRSVSKFKNLKKLFCQDFDGSILTSLPFVDALKILVHLKEFHFESLEDLDETRTFFEELNLNNNSLKIYYKSIDVQANPFTIEIEELSTKFYEDESGLYYRYLDFTSDHLKQTVLYCKNLEEMPKELIQKLNNLTELSLSCKKFSEDKWIALLKVSKLNSIHLHEQLEPKFLNLISKYCGESLVELNLNKCEDLNFLFSLKYLRTIKFNEFFDFKIFRKMIKMLHHLNQINIVADGSDTYQIKIENDYVKCSVGSNLVLTQSKSSFLSSINLIKYWSQLFCLDFIDFNVGSRR